ncbi:MAG: hypothetical protein GF398_14125 [Chitinivibrionales bacterium]|nr:hypothetical protein [Chitinivibrionales bacterium]
MFIHSDKRHGYKILRVKDDLGRETDFAELKNKVKECVDQGDTNVALAFTKESYFYTSSISGLVQCLGLVREKNGKLAIIQPNEGMLDTLRIVGLGKLIDIYFSEDEISSDNDTASRLSADPPLRSAFDGDEGKNA